MSISTEQRTTLRQEYESTPHRPPVDLKVFRELVRRAPSSAWLAMVRSNPIRTQRSIELAPTVVAEVDEPLFRLCLVAPAVPSVEVLGKTRGGPRTWTNLDSLAEFVESLLDSTDLKGRIRVHVV